MNLDTSSMPIVRVKAIAKPSVEEKVAFSGDVNPEEDVIKVLRVAAKEKEVEEPLQIPEPLDISEDAKAEEDDGQKAVPEMVDSEVDSESVSNNQAFSTRFINGSHYAVSNIGKLIQETMMQDLFFDTIKNDIVQSKKMYPADFYKILTTSIYKAIVGFCEFEQIEIPNGDKPGTHRGFKAPDVIVGKEFEPTMRYLERMFINDEINSKPDILSAMQAYRYIYNDYLGVQREVLPLLRSELTKRIQMTENGYEKVIGTVDNMIFVPVEVDDIKIVANAMAEAEEEGLNYDLKEKLDAQIAEESKEESDDKLDINAILANAAKEAMKEADETDDETLAFSSDVDATDDEFYYAYDEDEEVDDYIKTTIMVYHEDDTDIIKLNTADAFGEVIIPFYESLSTVDADKCIPSLADERNGMWDWLIHFTPLMMFNTSNPDKWLEFNDEEMHESFVHPVILQTKEDGSATIGMYIVDGIYEVQENGIEAIITDNDMLWKICTVIINNISTNGISHYTRNISREDLIVGEDVVRKSFVIEDDDGTERDIDTSDIDSQEDAAIKALLGGDPIIGVDANDEVGANVKAEEASPEESLIFTPIRKPHNQEA